MRTITPGTLRGRWFLLTARRLLMERGFRVSIIYKKAPRLVWAKGAIRGHTGILHNTVSIARLAPVLGRVACLRSP